MAYANLEFTNFQEIDLALGVRRSMRLAPNTVAYRTGAEIAISYHGNDIAIWNTDTKAITLQTSGWITSTTIGRLHQIARGNHLGRVGIVNGAARFTHTAKNHGWYSMEDPITIDHDGGVEHKDPDRYYGYSNADTYHAAALASNPLRGESEYKAILSMSLYELREWVKGHRREIGYKSIKNVNIKEIYFSLQEG